MKIVSLIKKVLGKNKADTPAETELETLSAAPEKETLSVLNEKFRMARQQYEEHGNQDYAHLRHLVFQLLQLNRVHYYKVTEDDLYVTLTIAQYRQYRREKATGIVEAFKNELLCKGIPEHIKDFDEAYAFMLEMVQAPKWVPLEDHNPCLLGTQILGSFNYFETLADNFLCAAMTVIRGSHVPAFYNNIFSNEEDERAFFQNRAILVKTLWHKKGKNIYMAKGAYKAMWEKVLAPEVKQYLGYYQVSFYASFNLYNVLARNLPLVQQRMKETPQLARLAYVKLGEEGFQQDAVSKLKEKLKASEGLTEQGWRWLTRQSAAVSLLFCTNMAHMAALANILAEFKVNAPASFLKEMSIGRARSIWRFQNKSKYINTIEEAERYLCDTRHAQLITKYIVKAVADEAVLRRKKGCLKEFLNDSLCFTVDWLDNVTEEDFAQFPAKHITFAWLNRKQAEWHEARIKEISSTDQVWACLVSEPVPLSEGLQLVPLLTSQELDSEGRRMHHCVGSYAAHCNAGRSRIFSFRSASTGKSIATLELGRDTDDTGPIVWEIRQVRGPCNKAVSSEVSTASKAFLRQFNKMWKKADEETRKKLFPPKVTEVAHHQLFDADDIPF